MMKSNTRKMKALLCLTTMLAPLSMSAYAQSSDSQIQAPKLDEIVVTATRREQSLNKVPASIAAYTQKTMDRQGVRDVDDIALLTPGLNFVGGSQFTGSNAQIAIRGIASSVGAATTGIYINDLPIQSRSVGFATSNTYPRIFDLERIEVLRGPQGTLFGAGAQGGAVRFITPSPSLTTRSLYGRSEVSTTKGGGTSYEMGLAAGGPIAEDKLGYRISAWHRKDGGWIDRADHITGDVIEKNANTHETTALRAAFTWALSDNVKVTPSIFYQKEKIADTNAYHESLSNPDESDYRQGGIQAQPVDDEFVAPSLDVEIDFGDVNLIAVSSYFDRSSKEHRDYTLFDSEIVGGPSILTFADQVATGFLNDTQKVFTQEVRLQSDSDAKLQWVLGAFYSDESQESTQRNQDSFYDPLLVGLYGVDLAFFGLSILPGDYVYNSLTTSDTKQLAGFGQVDYAFTDKLKLTVGARISDINVDHYQFLEGPWAGPVSSTETGSTSETSVTPKFGLAYQATDDNLYYGSIAKGFRPGGAQTQIPVLLCGADLAGLGLTESPVDYESDSLWSYEAGTKNTFMNGRLQFDASVFHIKWDNIQTFIEAPSCGSGFIQNTGSLTSNGFDLSLQGQFTESLSLGIVMGYNDAVFDETIEGGSGVILVEEGQEAQFGPKFTMTISGKYDYDLFEKPAYLRFDYSYAGKEPEANLSVFGINPEDRAAPKYTMLNLRAGLEIDNYEVALFVDNVGNSNPELSRLQILPGSTRITNATLRPRTMGITLGVRY